MRPFICAFKAIIGATAIFWISFFCLYLWCSCIAYHLKRKGITSGIYKGFNTAASGLGFLLVPLLYIACFGKEDPFGMMLALTLVLCFRMFSWAHFKEIEAAKQKALAAGNPEASSKAESIVD